MVSSYLVTAERGPADSTSKRKQTAIISHRIRIAYPFGAPTAHSDNIRSN
jgi:hypothetical protein